VIFIFFLGCGIAIFGFYILSHTGRFIIPGIFILAGATIALVGLYNFLAPEMGNRDAIFLVVSLAVASIISALAGKGLIRLLGVSIDGRLLYIFVGLPTIFIVWMLLGSIFPP
jgi:hypothetical protein